MKIGHLKFPDRPLALAPMEDITDIPFRLICKRLEADLVFTEFTSSEGLIRDAKNALQKVLFLQDERPIAIQLFGGVETSMVKAAKIAERYNPDFLDINCGCWVRNFTRRGEGAALLKDLPRLEAIVKSTVKATKLPVTVKTRLGWDRNSIVILDVAQMVEQAGAKALTVHCRTREQAHNGTADWKWLEKIKKVIRIPLIGNGDLKTPLDVKRMFETGCDGVMIGRGAVQNPWIFKQAKHFLSTGSLPPEVSLEEKINLCIEHLKLSVEHKGPWFGIRDFRKHYSGYLRGVHGVAKLRADMMRLTKQEDLIERLQRFGQEHLLHHG